MVDVDHDKADRLGMPLGARDLTFQCGLERAPVRDRREAIGGRHPLHLLEQDGVAQGKCGVRTEPFDRGHDSAFDARTCAQRVFQDE